ncbi:MAG TPA: radical SAM/SPASM domain-containing protein [bacterium]|nr:radical SAM/SPASM domain-containing protein [bacterium]HEX68453.1 radical SAM/SPASM domain-containing protein [bacterium]
MNRRVKEFLEGKEILSLGPRILELSITTACDSSCLGCWCHSPFVDFPQEKKGLFLPFNIIEELICELKEKGLEEVQISGAGEPLLHPQLKEIISLIKRKGIRCHLVTNFLSAGDEEILFFIEEGLDLLTVSLWAGTPETFVLLHPNRKEEDFERISEKLKKLRKERDERGKFYPKVKVYHVLNHLNAEEMEVMLQHALDVGADMIEFKSIDIIPGKTDFLAFTENDVQVLLESIERLKKKVDFPYSVNYDPLNVPHLIVFDDIELRKEIMDYGRFLLKNLLPPGFSVSFDHLDPNNPEPEQLNVRCPKKRINHKSILREEPDQSFYFFFFREYCKGCPMISTCFLRDDEVKEVRLPYLSLLALGRLEREITNYQKKGSYACDIVDKIPCYTGWLYARVEADGEVIPCCKGHAFPVGNIFEKSFWEIWNGEKERLFRREGRKLLKEGPIFQLIGCRKGCDNIGLNISFHGEILTG